MYGERSSFFWKFWDDKDRWYSVLFSNGSVIWSEDTTEIYEDGDCVVIKIYWKKNRNEWRSTIKKRDYSIVRGKRQERHVLPAGVAKNRRESLHD
jgi:hypothetical protein